MSFKETEFGKIYSDCKVFNLDEVYTFSSGLSKSRKEFGFGNPFVTFKDVFYNYFLPENLSELANTNEKEISKCSVKRGDVFLTRTSETSHELGKSSVALKDYPNATFNGFTKRLRPKLDGIVLPEYAGYYFRSNLFRNQINSMVTMTTRASLNNDTMAKLKIVVPKIDEQKAIAKILSDLDEKIEVNNKINKNLEEMAQSIFKQWFVDFEFPNEEGKPYKSSGGEMVESELGMIPKGWKIFKLGDFIKFIKGKKPKKIEEKFFDGCELYLTIDVLNRNSEIFANKDKIIEVNDDDILMVMDGASSGSLYYGLNGILGSTLAKISVLNTIDKSFLYYYLKLNESSIKSHLTGSAIPHTDKEFINKLCLAIPNDEMILKKAYTILNNIRNHTINLNTECSKIKKVRDTLLPKLMSGEIRVPLENSEN